MPHADPEGLAKRQQEERVADEKRAAEERARQEADAKREAAAEAAKKKAEEDEPAKAAEPQKIASLAQGPDVKLPEGPVSDTTLSQQPG